MNRRLRDLFVLGLAIVLTTSPAAAQELTLTTVLARAGAYVVEIQRQLSGIVAEEAYVQDVRVPTSAGRAMPRVTHRELKSDLLLVRPAGADRWIQFRDVFDVDGRPVRDRSERLLKLFLTPSSSTATQLELIAEESSRYNIGNLQRTVNVPVLALVILATEQQPRFAFKRVEKGIDPPVRSAAASAMSVWVIEYREVQPQTIIRTTNFRDLPSRGRFWIEPETGRVLASELIAEDVILRGVIAVGYDLEAALQVMVPVQMQEHYEVRRDLTRVIGRATYSRFRQFQVKVDEKMAPIKEREQW